MNAVEMSAPARNYADPRSVPQAPRRSEVIRLSASLDRLEKALIDHADRLDTVLRPDTPTAPTGGQCAQPESRLANEVNRVDYLCDRVVRLTERIEA